MAFDFGQFNEFSDPVTFGDPVIMAVAKAIEMNPFKGAFYQSMGAPAATLAQKQFDVYSRSKTIRDGVVGDGTGETGGWDDSATTGLKMTADVIKGLTIGHVLKVGDEVINIKSVSRGANTIDVYSRGDGGTTAAAHADQDTFTVIGYAGNDTDLKNVESMSEDTSLYSNYIQTVFEVIDWTKHAELMRKGLNSSNATIVLVREAEIRVAEMLSRMAILGVKQKPADDSKRYMSAGLLHQLRDTNSGKRTPLLYQNTGALVENKMLSAIEQVYQNGGSVDSVWCSPANKRIINTFNMVNSDLAVNTDKSDHVAGTYITHLNYEGRLIEIKVDIDIPDNCIPIVKQSSCKKGWLEGDGLCQKDEPSASSREKKKSLQGSVGFLIEDVGENHILMDGITS